APDRDAQRRAGLAPLAELGEYEIHRTLPKPLNQLAGLGERGGALHQLRPCQRVLFDPGEVGVEAVSELLERRALIPWVDQSLEFGGLLSHGGLEELDLGRKVVVQQRL